MSHFHKWHSTDEKIFQAVQAGEKGGQTSSQSQKYLVINREKENKEDGQYFGEYVRAWEWSQDWKGSNYLKLLGLSGSLVTDYISIYLGSITYQFNNQNFHLFEKLYGYRICDREAFWAAIVLSCKRISRGKDEWTFNRKKVIQTGVTFELKKKRQVLVQILTILSII